jgi:hypothetical protein
MIWFIFGVYQCGYVDIADTNGDVITHVNREEAEAICDRHNSALAQRLQHTKSDECTRR